MVRSILLIFLLIVSGSALGQTLNFRATDKTSQLPLEGVNIHMVDSLGNRLDLVSNDSGWAQLSLPDSLAHGGNFYIVGSKTKYISAETYYTYDGKDTTLIELGLGSSQGCEFPPDPIYDLGQIQPKDNIEHQLDGLIKTSKSNPGLVFSLNFGYAPEEKNGHRLSEKRAKYITDYLKSNGLDGDEFIVKISEASSSVLTFEVEKVND